MKRFSRIFAVLMAVVMTLSALVVVSFADDKPTLEKDNVINDWNADHVGRLFRSVSGHQSKVTLTDEGMLIEYTGGPDDGADPYFTFQISNYYKQFSNNCPASEDACYIVFKLKASADCDGTFEVFTANPAAFDSGSADYYCDGEWQYVLVDMFLTTLTESKLSTIRIDWSATATLEGANMLISEIAFFGDEDAAYAYIDAGYEAMDPNHQTATEAPTEEATEAPTEVATEEVTEQATEAAATVTEAATEAEKSGCGGVITVGAAAIVMAAAAAFVLKKKN